MLFDKLKYIALFTLTSTVASCQSDKIESNQSDQNLINSSSIERTVVTVEIDSSVYVYNWMNKYDYKASLINNIRPPKGYERIETTQNSFASWLQHLPLSTDNTVYLYNGEKKYNQSAQFKVLDIDVGKRDLQQCADAVMRLRGEYLYASNQFNKIHFKYTNGVNISFSKWSSGFYPSLKSNNVVWTPSSNDQSYKSFKKYMINIFMYAGTASLEKEMKKIPLSEIKAGDVLIKGGFPGHAVIVLDVAINNETNDKVFIIAQSYMPAQSIHILKNPHNTDYSPWYSLKELSTEIVTPEWIFYPNQLKRFIE